MTKYDIIDGVQTPLTDDEDAAIDLQNLQVQSLPQPAFEAAMRLERDVLLAACDWRAGSDLTMSDDWRNYRQSLRDLPAQAGFPNAITWPTAPDA